MSILDIIGWILVAICAPAALWVIGSVLLWPFGSLVTVGSAPYIAKMEV